MNLKPNVHQGHKGLSVLADMRIKRGWTQAEVARRMGYSRSVYAQIESCNRAGTPHQWKMLEDIFECRQEILKSVSTK